MNQNLHLLMILIIMSILGCAFILLSNSLLPSGKERYAVFAQVENNNIILPNTITNETWISKRDNLNITLELEPKIPIIDEWTKLKFEVRDLDSGNLLADNLTINVTMTDHDGRLFKFPEQVLTDGKFNIEYIFPDDGQHRLILQLYKNSTAFTIASFELTVPHPPPSKGFLSQLFQTQPF